MTAYLVTGIAQLGDPNQTNRLVRNDPTFDGLHLTIIGSSARERAVFPEEAPTHTGIVRILLVQCSSI